MVRKKQENKGRDEKEGKGLPMCVEQKGPNVILHINAKPNSKETRVLEVSDDQLTIALDAQPIDGEANAQLLKYLSRVLGVGKGRVTVGKGGKSRVKLIFVEGTDAEEVLWQLKQQAEW